MKEEEAQFSLIPSQERPFDSCRYQSVYHQQYAIGREATIFCSLSRTFECTVEDSDRYWPNPIDLIFEIAGIKGSADLKYTLIKSEAVESATLAPFWRES